jgi:hypothetical protein
MVLVYGISGDLLLKIADGDVERAAGEQIRGGIVVARLGKLPVGRGSGEISKAQSSSNHDKAENNNQRSAFRCAITRREELFHGVKTFIGLGLLGQKNIRTAEH